MDAERWQRLSPLLDTLFELDVGERVEKLRVLRDADPALADEVESLMALEQDSDDFMAEPLVAPMLGARAGGEIGDEAAVAVARDTLGSANRLVRIGHFQLPLGTWTGRISIEP